MLSEVIVSRYALAFLQYAKGSIGFDAGVRELVNFKKVLSDSPEFKGFLESPDVGARPKFSVIDKVVAGNFAEEIGHFLKLLIEKNRIDQLSNIIEYVRVNYGGGGALSALLTSALALEDEELSAIKNALEKKTGKKVNLYVTFSPELLGGFKVRIGNKVFDSSLRRQLLELRTRSNQRME